MFGGSILSVHLFEGYDVDEVLHVETARVGVGLANLDEVDQVTGAEGNLAVLDVGRGVTLNAALLESGGVLWN